MLWILNVILFSIVCIVCLWIRKLAKPKEKQALASNKKQSTVQSILDLTVNSSVPMDFGSFQPRDPNFVEEFPNFLSPYECDTLIQLARPKLKPSEVFGSEANQVDPRHRISEQCWLTRENALVRRLCEKIAMMTQKPMENQEDLQVVKYARGGFFKAHQDACNPKAVQDCSRMDGTRGPRLQTFLMQLNDNQIGGQTHFPQKNLTIQPQQGKAVLFQNVDSHNQLLENSIHGGLEIVQGEKWICNLWIRVGCKCKAS